RAYRAIRALSTVPTKAVPLLGGKLVAVPPSDLQRLKQLISNLDSEEFGIRKEATVELEKLGEAAEAAIHRALANQPPAESRRRMEQLLDKLATRPLPPNTLRDLRAIEVLENIATQEARELLRKLAAGAAEVRLTCEAKAALERLEKRPKQ